MEWWAYLAMPALSGMGAFIGTICAVKTDIVWIKRELSRHDRELVQLRKR